MSLLNVLKLISSQTGLKFSIQDDLILVKYQNGIQIDESLLVPETFIEVPSLDLLETALENLEYTIIYQTKKPQFLTDQVVRGSVNDDKGEPLIGATVVLKETGEGTVTDENGKFVLYTPEKGAYTVIVSFVGFDTREIEINNETQLNITLKPSFSELEEVVVIGYTSSKPKDFTGAIKSVDGNQIDYLPVNGIEQALQAQVAGVQVTNEGAPGGASSVRIRGYGTIGDNDPLYIIDGVPTKTGLNQFSNADIENIQVLKDASATAIYGSRAANGVVIINTKKGSQDGLKLQFNSYASVQQPINLPEMLNAEQYANLLWQAQRNSGISPSNDLFGSAENPVIPEYIDAEGIIPASIPGTDWFDEVFNPALMQSYNLSVQSGKEGIKNYTAASYLEQEGIMENTGFKKYTFRTNTELKAGILTIGENLAVSVTNTQSVTTNQALGSRMIHTYRINPVVPIRDVNGDFAGPVNGVQGALNPIGLNYLDRNDRVLNNRIFGNLFVDLEFLPGLNLRSTLGVDYADINTKDYDPKYKMGITERGETIFFQSEASRLQLMFNNTLQYKLLKGDHKLTALIGQEAIKFTANDIGGVSSNFITDDIDFIQLNTGSGQSSNFSGGTEWALLSFFGRVDYQFRGTYLFGASIRRDGSSRFSESNRYSIFPAFSAGWRISNERFLKSISIIDDAMVRVSYGKSGNQEIGDFPSFSTFSSDAWDSYYAIDGSNDRATIGFKPTRIGNPNIKWETTTQANFGLDIRFLKRFEINLDYFIKNTEDILLQRPTLAIEGQADAPFVNLGKMENKGMELSLGYQSKEGQDFSYQLNGNISIIRNKVIRLADDVVQLTGLVNNTYSRNLILTVTQEGLPISQFYGHVVEGIFETQQEVQAHATQEGKGIGRLKFSDLNKDGIIDDNDKTIIGNPHPDLFFGFNANLYYKNFDFSLLIQGVQGVEIYNFTRYYTDFYYDLGNRHVRTLDAWSPINTDSDVPLLAAVDVNNELRPSTYFIEDGSFLRIKNIQLGYTFALGKNQGRSLRIYAQAQNLLTLTSYEGIDPEIGLVNSFDTRRNLDIGVDRGVYPNARIFLTGLSLNF
ncbi:MAG: TonB-dependent receptor [Bacteroidota bacterium]